MAENKAKKNLVVSYERLTPEVLEALEKKYPGGVENYVKRITAGDKVFYAVTIDTPDASYLVKVPVKIDSEFDEEEDHSDVNEFPETSEEETSFPADEEESFD